MVKEHMDFQYDGREIWYVSSLKGCKAVGDFVQDSCFEDISNRGPGYATAWAEGDFHRPGSWCCPDSHFHWLYASVIAYPDGYFRPRCEQGGDYPDSAGYKWTCTASAA